MILLGQLHRGGLILFATQIIQLEVDPAHSKQKILHLMQFEEDPLSKYPGAQGQSGGDIL